MNDNYKKKKKVYGIISIIVVVLLVAAITYFVFVEFKKFGSTPEEFRDFIQQFGVWSRLVAFGIQMLQVVVALIPGEVVEVGLGYAFGAVEGTLLCYAGNIAASAIIFFLTRKFGVKLVEIFVEREKIDNFKLINTDKKLKTFVFWTFFIPGIPKDVMVYIAGLTKIKLWEFIVISSIARIPSVISSTIGGAYVGEGDYLTAAIIFVITGAISLACILAYNKVTKNKIKSKEEKTV